MQRRTFLAGAPGLISVPGLLAVLGPTSMGGDASASPIDPAQTFVMQPGEIRFEPWPGLPPGSGEMARLYGDLNRAGPYLVLMKWHPGWFSAPHSYATDRIQMVMSGTWWVDSGADFTPNMAVAAPAGSFVKRAARTWHYDGAPGNAKAPVVIAIFGLGPVDIRLADPSQPAWRRV